MNAARRYVGLRPFYAIVSGATVSQGQIMGARTDDPAGTIAAKLRLLCGAVAEAIPQPAN
jgi:DNA gyrase inhibitor GyrI